MRETVRVLSASMTKGFGAASLWLRTLALVAAGIALFGLLAFLILQLIPLAGDALESRLSPREIGMICYGVVTLCAAAMVLVVARK